MDIMRLLAIISTGLFLLIICLMLIGQFFEFRIKKNTYSLLAILFTLVIAFMAYSSYYGNGGDIKRYYDIMRGMEGKSFAWAHENGFYKNTILTNFLFWAIAQTGNYQLLPMFASSFTTIASFYIISREQRITNVSSCAICVYFLQIFAVATLAAILSGVRQTMAVSLFAVAVYRDFIEKKKNILTIICYLLTCTLHVATLFFLLIRLCAFVKGKMKWIFLLWGLLIPLLEKYSESEGLFGEAIDKLFLYQDIETLDIRFILARLAILCLLYYMIIKLKQKNHNDRYLNFLEVFIVFSFGSIFVQHLFSRQMTALVHISFPLLVRYYNACSKNRWEMVQAINTFLCLGLFAYQVVFAINYWQFI